MVFGIAAFKIQTKNDSGHSWQHSIAASSSLWNAHVLYGTSFTEKNTHGKLGFEPVSKFLTDTAFATQ